MYVVCCVSMRCVGQYTARGFAQCNHVSSKRSLRQLRSFWYLADTDARSSVQCLLLAWVLLALQPVHTDMRVGHLHILTLTASLLVRVL